MRANSEQHCSMQQQVRSLSCRHEPIADAKTNVILKPGVAFGTGEHATTRLCLRWLQQQPVQSTTVMDYGCGSGILAVAACLWGASSVVCGALKLVLNESSFPDFAST